MKRFLMKHHFLFSILFFIWLLSKMSFVSAQITFQKTFGGSITDDKGLSAMQTNDGGFIITGGKTFGAGGWDVLLIKTDSVGNLLWSRAIGKTGQEWARDITQLDNNWFASFGSTDSYWGTKDFYLLLTDTNGVTYGKKLLGGIVNADDIGYSIQPTMEGSLSLIMAGETNSFGAGDNDVYLVHTDVTGNVIWSKTFGGSLGDYGRAVQQLPDSGYIIAGYSYSFGAGGHDYYLIRTNSIGDTLWTKAYGDWNWDECTAMKLTNDGGIIMAGYTNSFGAGDYDIYVVKTNSYGDVQWSKTYGGTGSDLANGIYPTSDGGYIIIGYTSSFSSSNQVYLIRMDSMGTHIWSKTFTPPSIYNGGGVGFSVQETVDNGFIISATAYKNGMGDVWLIKTDADGNSDACNQISVPTIETTVSTIVSNTNTQINTGGTLNNESATETNPLFIQTDIITTISPPICVVTVDSLSLNNIIVWNKTLSSGNADTFLIYRDTANNDYGLLGRVAYDSLSHFIDMDRSLYAANGDPNVSSWRYKLAVMDTCGYISTTSPFHQTIFVQNIGGNFSWNHYQIEGQPVPVPDLSNYLFQRDNFSTGSWQTIQTLSASSQSFTDPQFSNFPNASYRVMTQWSTPCTATKSSVDYNSSRSNVKAIAPPGTVNELSLEYAISIYPNPNDGTFTIELNNSISQFPNNSITIYNMVGEELYHTTLNSTQKTVNIKFLSGIYQLKLITNYCTINKKVIIE